MATEDAGSSPSRPPRPAGKRLAEKRQGFLIYLPPSLHAKLRTEAIRRAVSMSEVASIALAQFLLDEPWREVQTPLAPPVEPEPFVGRFGGERQTPKVADKVPELEPEAAAGPLTYEVE